MAAAKRRVLKERSSLVHRMREGPFTISTDGSNDTGSKLFPLVVRVVDDSSSTVNLEVLAVTSCEGPATGRNIFSLIADVFERQSISLGVDSANVMTGCNEGLYGYMKRKQPNLHLSGCVCHLIHIGAQKGAACLPLKADEILTDIFFYLERSSNRQYNFKQTQQLHDIQQLKVR